MKWAGLAADTFALEQLEEAFGHGVVMAVAASRADTSKFGAGRGFVSAYHVDTGKLAWKFYVIPGNPADGFGDEAQGLAAKAWTGEWWKHGGGGQWNRKVRSPGGGDNLFLCSIVR